MSPEKAKKDYYTRKLKSVSGCLRKCQQLLRTVLNKNSHNVALNKFVKDGQIITDPKSIVEHFNDYFVNIGDSVAASIKDALVEFTDFLDINSKYFDSFALSLTDIDEVTEIVNGFSNKSSSGHDAIPVNLLKVCIDDITEPISLLVNSSLQKVDFQMH